MDDFEGGMEVEEQATSTKKKKRILTSKENIKADLNELVLILETFQVSFVLIYFHFHLYLLT